MNSFRKQYHIVLIVVKVFIWVMAKVFLQIRTELNPSCLKLNHSAECLISCSLCTLCALLNSREKEFQCYLLLYWVITVLVVGGGIQGWLLGQADRSFFHIQQSQFLAAPKMDLLAKAGPMLVMPL